MSPIRDPDKEFEFHKTRIEMQVDAELRAVALRDAQRAFKELERDSEDRHLVQNILLRLQDMKSEIGDPDEMYEIRSRAARERTKNVARGIIAEEAVKLRNEFKMQLFRRTVYLILFYFLLWTSALFTLFLVK